MYHFIDETTKRATRGINFSTTILGGDDSKAVAGFCERVFELGIRNSGAYASSEPYNAAKSIVTYDSPIIDFRYFNVTPDELISSIESSSLPTISIGTEATAMTQVGMSIRVMVQVVNNRFTYIEMVCDVTAVPEQSGYPGTYSLFSLGSLNPSVPTVELFYSQLGPGRFNLTGGGQVGSNAWKAGNTRPLVWMFTGVFKAASTSMNTNGPLDMLLFWSPNGTGSASRTFQLHACYVNGYKSWATGATQSGDTIDRACWILPSNPGYQHDHVTSEPTEGIYYKAGISLKTADPDNPSINPIYQGEDSNGQQFYLMNVSQDSSNHVMRAFCTPTLYDRNGLMNGSSVVEGGGTTIIEADAIGDYINA